jgi:ribosome maturation factor RimP
MVHPCIPPLLEIANPIAESLNLEIVHAVLQTNYNPPILRIDIRSQDGSTGLDHCEQMSRALEEALEQQSFLLEAYVLEVSSPGVPEILTTDQEFISFKGFPVLLAVQTPNNGVQSYRGSLLGRDDTHITINQKGRPLKFPRQQVTQVRLVETLDQ